MRGSRLLVTPTIRARSRSISLGEKFGGRVGVHARPALGRRATLAHGGVIRR